MRQISSLHDKIPNNRLQKSNPKPNIVIRPLFRDSDCILSSDDVYKTKYNQNIGCFSDI